MNWCSVPLRRWAGVIRDFVSHGQLLDLAVALVIGDAFTKVVEALVDHLLTPILGFLLSGIDIAHLTSTLHSDRWPQKPAVTLAYGKFLQELIYFVIIAISLSILVCIVNKLLIARKRNQVAIDRLPTRQELILMEHTDLLKVIAQSLRK
jgi:large conductance mechanosensitive channel